MRGSGHGLFQDGVPGFEWKDWDEQEQKQKQSR
jgi:hypothetical protein